MISDALARRAQELAASGTAFVTATVVRVQRPTSVEPGSVALVLGDGTIEGFVGGVCAEHSVRAYSLVTLRDGEPVLLKILPDAEVEVPEDADPADTEQVVEVQDGAVTVKNPCLSGGAIEVFLEPSLPAPRVVVVGDTPIAVAVREIGAQLGLEMIAGGEPSGADFAVVVAGHGRDELHALRLGLDARLPYVGLVASARRGAGVVDELRADGVPDDQLDRIDVPAGIEIGARLPSEIALSILAKVVAVRRSGDIFDAELPIAGSVTDPICGMLVMPMPDTPRVEHNGETVYFCCEGCKRRFEAEHQHAA
jgi:xanthine dehydrogenase accessory factor